MEQKSTSAKQSLLEKLQDATNILVTVSRDPSVDQLAACLGLTIWLNKIDKHATAVFSGEVPSTLEFLKPEETLEKNTDSLRDFIIALDKSKADKLRYKVEDSVVKIFITPYRTSLSADDLEFSQGDFNVDMVIALGVTNQEDIDNAITAHGRILHDATVVTINVANQSELGAVNWHDEQASSLCELIVELGNGLDKAKLDGQIATALLTGVVAETDRFSNEKTTPQTMSVSAELMGAGANQQLVASKLEEPAPEPVVPEPTQTEETPTESKDGTLEIDHEHDPAPELPEVEETPPAPEVTTESSQEEKQPEAPAEEPAPESTDEAENTRGNKMITNPPERDGVLTANSQPEDETSEPTVDPLTLGAAETTPQILGHGGQRLPDEDTNTEASSDDTPAPTTDTEPKVPDTAPASDELQPPPPDWMPKQSWMDESQAAEAPEGPATPAPTDTLEDIERSVHSAHVDGETAVASPDLDSARDEVMAAINSAPSPTLEPTAALNASPIELSATPEPVAEPPVDPMIFDPSKFEIAGDNEVLGQASTPTDPNTPVSPELTGPINQPFTMPLPGAPLQQSANPTPPTSSDNDPTAPPPVPPPLMPPGFPPAGQ